MAYTVKLAIFPPWKAPIPYQTLTEVFPSLAAASAAGAHTLASITEPELVALASQLPSRSTAVEGRTITSMPVPEDSIHGYLIYDGDGIEVGNWTTLDVALERAGGEAER